MSEIREGTYKVQSSAKDFAPVYPHKAKKPYKKDYVGGSLRESIHVKFYPKYQTGLVFTTLEYAVYQEFGTVFQEGTPFMVPAMNLNRIGIYQSMGKYLREQLKAKSNG